MKEMTVAEEWLRFLITKPEQTIVSVGIKEFRAICEQAVKFERLSQLYPVVAKSLTVTVERESRRKDETK